MTLMSPRKSATTTALLLLSCLLASFVRPAAAEPGSEIEFTTTEGTWISLDVASDSQSLVFELLGDVYSVTTEGGEAKPVLTGRAFQSQPRFSPDGFDNG